MKSEVYSVFDKKAGYYRPIFCAQGEVCARRVMLRMMLETQSDIAMFPSDFELYRIGVFDDHDGSVTVDGKSMKSPRMICNLGELKDAELSKLAPSGD